MIPPPPTSTLFPYTTLFRSCLVISAISAVIGITLANTIRPGDRIDPATAAAIEQRYATDATTRVAEAPKASSALTTPLMSVVDTNRSVEHTSELLSQSKLVCRLPRAK